MDAPPTPMRACTKADVDSPISRDTEAAWGAEVADDTDSGEPAIQLDAVTPDVAWTLGYREVTLSDRGFGGAPTLSIGGQACASLSVMGDTELTCLPPAGPAGANPRSVEPASAVLTASGDQRSPGGLIRVDDDV